MVRLFRLVSVLSMCVLLWAANSGGVQARPSRATMTISYMTWGAPAEHALYASLLKQFERANPGINVNYIYVPQNYTDKLDTMVAGNTTPDVFWADASYAPQYFKTGKVTLLAPYIKKYPELTRGYVPGLLQYGQYHGRQYALPKDWEPYVVWINEDEFRKAHVPIPTSKWTIRDFINDARKLTVTSSGRTTQYGVALDTWWGSWEHFIGNAGGEFFQNGKSHFNDPTVKQGLGYMIDLIQKYKASPSPSGLQQTGQGQQQMFEIGRAAMYPAGRWVLPEFRQTLKFHYIAVEMPMEKRRINSIFSGTLCVSASSPHKAAAVSLVRFIMGPRGIEDTAGLGLDMPPYTRYVHDTRLIKPPPPVAPFIAASKYLGYKSQLALTRTTLFNEYMDKYAQPELDKVFDGKESISDAVKKIDDQANSKLFK